MAAQLPSAAASSGPAQGWGWAARVRVAAARPGCLLPMSAWLGLSGLLLRLATTYQSLFMGVRNRPELNSRLHVHAFSSSISAAIVVVAGVLQPDAVADAGLAVVRSSLPIWREVKQHTVAATQPLVELACQTAAADMWPGIVPALALVFLPLYLQGLTVDEGRSEARGSGAAGYQQQQDGGRGAPPAVAAAAQEVESMETNGAPAAPTRPVHYTSGRSRWRSSS